MKDERDPLRGAGKVYAFTLGQTLKGKAGILTLAIVLLLAAVSVPATALLLKGETNTSGNMASGNGQEKTTGSGIISLLSEETFEKAGIRREQREILTSDYEVQQESAGEYLKTAGQDRFGVQFGAQMAYSIIMILLASLSGTYIIRSVVEEKASRLAEVLLVDVRPMALLTGKILAVMTYIFGLFVSMAAAFCISWAVTGNFLDLSVIGEWLRSAGITAQSFRISPATALILLVSLVLGYLIFAFLSGLFGSGCAQMEDVEPANVSVVLVVMAGYFLATFTAPFSDRAALTAAVSLFPVSGIFCAPVRYITGDIGMGLLLVSWALQALTAISLARLCAGLYEGLMLYRGRRLDLGGLLLAARGQKGKEENGQ